MALKKAPLSQFEDWVDNVRDSIDQEHVNNLSVSIADSKDGEINLHHPLLAAPNPKSGKLAVIGGSHRLGALRKLAGAGKISWSTEIQYNHKDVDLDDPQAIKLALEENMLRKPMNVIDECDAFARMAISGAKPKDIAIQFSMSETTVKQRISLGRLPDEAKALIRKNLRSLSWGQAMTAADKATQKKILADIAASPTTWMTEQDVRKFLNEDTIPEAFALFDSSLYKGPLVRDMFEGDRFRDRAEFWELQNQAIEAKKADLETKGYAKVFISHTPYESWKYVPCEDQSQSIAIIEVSPNGRVTVYDGIKARDEGGTPNSDTIEEDSESMVQVGSSKVSAGALEFGRSVRSAILQSEVAVSPRKAKEILVAGLLGHTESPFRALRARMKGDQKMRTGEAFDKAAENQRAVAKTMAQATSPEAIVAFVAGLDDTALDALLASLVADRLAFTAATSENGLLAGIVRNAGPVRKHWQPSDAFLKNLSAEELRRIALDILPSNRQKGLLAARKGDLLAALRTGFADAAAKSPTLDAEAIERINCWAPSWIGFQATEASTGETAAEDSFLAEFATPLTAAA